MKNFKTIFLFAFAVILFNGCEQQSEENTVASGYTITGKIKNYSGEALILEELTTGGLVFLDSATVAKDGSFEFSGTLPEKTFAALRLPKGTIPVIVDTASKIRITIDAEKPDDFIVIGSDDSKALGELLDINNYFMNSMEMLSTKYGQYNTETPPDSIQNKIRAEYQFLVDSRTDSLTKFIINTSNPIVAYFGSTFLLTDAGFTELDEIDRKFYNQLQNSKYAKAHHARVGTMRRTAIGSLAPDIVMPDRNGEKVALSSLRGKIVLIDFWASWCPPCRAENPNVVRLYNKYHSKGFEIYGVSLDDNKDNWFKAIEQDGLPWIHVSDLQKWNSSVVKQYNIEGIPLTVLLDKEGRIISKKLRGKELETKLEELFR